MYENIANINNKPTKETEQDCYEPQKFLSKVYAILWYGFGLAVTIGVIFIMAYVFFYPLKSAYEEIAPVDEVYIAKKFENIKNKKCVIKGIDDFFKENINRENDFLMSIYDFKKISSKCDAELAVTNQKDELERATKRLVIKSSE